MLGAQRSFVFAAASLALAALTAAPAQATPHCRNVHTVVLLQAEAQPTCGSEIFLCANGVLRGSLRGTSSFIGTSNETTVDTGSTGVILLTGDNTIHTEDGDLYTKDAIVLSTVGAGEFAEIDVIVGGTGAYSDATGVLTGTGTFAGGSGEGLLVGQICTP